MSMFSRTTTAELPGLTGATRDASRPGRALRRMGAGDIVIIDAPDIGRAMAQRLVDARVAAVVNVSHFTTGAVPNYGPQMLLDAGIVLVENVSRFVLEKVKDGKAGRLDDGTLYYGERAIASGEVVTAEEVTRRFDEARAGLADRMEAFSGNLVEFTRHEAPLYIDGLGIPEVPVDLKDAKVVIVGPGADHREVLRRLKHFIREYDPVLIGADAGADALVEQGYTPHLIIGDPAGIGVDALRSGAKVVLPADPDGTAAGLERIQDLGIGAMTFPALTSRAADLAVLLANYHGAGTIVTVGSSLDLDEVFAESGDAETPATLLARLKAGPSLVDGRIIAGLYEVRGAGFGVAWAILAVFVLVAVVLLIAATAGDGSMTENLIDTWNSVALWFQGLFKGLVS